MSDTLDYFGLPHEEEDAPVAVRKQAPPPRAETPGAEATAEAEAQVAESGGLAAQGEAEGHVQPVAVVWPRPDPRPAPSLPSPLPGAAQQTLATYRRSRYQPIPSRRLESVPSKGVPWPPMLTNVLIYDLSPYEFLVYHYLFIQSYGLGQLTYSCPRRDISTATGLSEPTIRRALQALETELSLLVTVELPRFVYEFSVLVPNVVLASWTFHRLEERGTR
jgi:hypothetical protein